MAFDYRNSIAQKYVKFITEQSILTIPGANYEKLMVFLDSEDATDEFVADPGVDQVVELSASSYNQILKSGGELIKWFTDFYVANSQAKAYVTTFDAGSTAWVAEGLQTIFPIVTERAYFKLVYSSRYGMLPQLELARLCGADQLSQYIYGTHDVTILQKASQNEAAQFLQIEGLDAYIAYHPNVDHNPVMIMLGNAMAQANITGTYVGNKLDFLAISGFSSSGTAGENLDPVAEQNLRSYNVGYFTTLGDDSGQVVLEGGKTILNGLIGANWIVSYIDFVAAVKAAQYMVQPNRYRNNDTYQGILLILEQTIIPFTNLGRLANYKVTAPPFSGLTLSGDAIVVPDAWQADYVDNLRSVTVYGTLTIVI